MITDRPSTSIFACSPRYENMRAPALWNFSRTAADVSPLRMACGEASHTSTSPSPNETYFADETYAIAPDFRTDLRASALARRQMLSVMISFMCCLHASNDRTERQPSRRNNVRESRQPERAAEAVPHSAGHRSANDSPKRIRRLGICSNAERGQTQRSRTATGRRTRDGNHSIVLSDAHTTDRRGGGCRPRRVRRSARVVTFESARTPTTSRRRPPPSQYGAGGS